MVGDDCISRHAAIDRIESHLRVGDELYPLTDADKILNHAFEIAASCVYNLPSVQPEETIEEQERSIDEVLRVARDIATIIQNEQDMRVICKRGKWIDKDGGLATCSECGDRWGVWSVMNFCPNCGADMRGTDDVD